MRAMILDRPGTPLVERDLEPPEPGPGQLLLRVHACGVCRTDLHVHAGELSRPKLPLVLGHEIVGTVLRGGEGAARFAPGATVVPAPGTVVVPAPGTTTVVPAPGTVVSTPPPAAVPQTLRAEEIETQRVRANTIYANKIEANEILGVIHQDRNLKVGNTKGEIKGGQEVVASVIYADEIRANSVVADHIYVRNIRRR